MGCFMPIIDENVLREKQIGRFKKITDVAFFDDK